MSFNHFVNKKFNCTSLEDRKINNSDIKSKYFSLLRRRKKLNTNASIKNKDKLSIGAKPRERVKNLSLKLVNGLSIEYNVHIRCSRNVTLML